MVKKTSTDGSKQGGDEMPFAIGATVEVTAEKSPYHGRFGKVSRFCKNGSTKMVYVIFNEGMSSEIEKRLYTRSLRESNKGVNKIPGGGYVKAHNHIVLDALEVLRDIRDDLKDKKIDMKTEDRLHYLTGLIKSLMIEDIEEDVKA